MKKVVLVGIYLILGFLLPLMVNAQTTISWANTPVNNGGLVIVKYNFNSDIVGSTRIYISFDTDSTIFYGTNKIRKVMGSGVIVDTMPIQLPNTPVWIKVNVKNGVDSVTTSICKVAANIIPTKPWGIIDSVIQKDQTTFTAYGRCISYGTPVIVKIACGVNDTFVLAVTKTNSEAKFNVSCSNRILDRVYTVYGVFINSAGSYKSKGVIIKNSSVLITPATITNTQAVSTGNTLVISTDYNIPIGTMDIYASIATDSLFSSPIKNWVFENCSSVGNLSATTSGLSPGTYWLNFIGIYNNKIVVSKIKFNYLTTDIESVSNDKFNIYPNPTTSALFISVPSSGSYQIINMVGQVMQNGVLADGTNEMNVSNLSQGIYIIQMENGKYAKFQKD